ncbi:MAG TPA: asparaginase domain-containing protein [Dehalococcoidia bacterium]|nr:asparaginase domain-containing protein [Dehalococcoidia bacterium]
MAEFERSRIAVFSGPTATIQNTVPLVTSNRAREKYRLPPRTHEDGTPLRFDHLRPQRLAAPVTVYVEQFSAHPLESDAADLYGPPDGYLDRNGALHPEPSSPNDRPVYEVTLRPEDGLYLLPYMARQADGTAWEDDTAYPGAPEHLARQPFLPDPSRLFEEIDRFGLGEEGLNSLLSGKADYDFIRAAPSGGYKKGLSASARTDLGDADIPPERMGRDFFNYKPRHLRTDPPRAFVARVVNMVQSAMDSGAYAGAIWLEGSPNIEETLMWLNLLIDSPLPICGNSSQRPHGSLSNDGDHNIVDSVDWILSGAWRDASGRNAAGVVAVLDQLIFTAREVQKGDARPGGYLATGGHGGVIGSMGHSPGRPVLTFVPGRRHTYQSAVNVHQLPQSVGGVLGHAGGPSEMLVPIKDASGCLLASALPEVRFVKSARYLPAEVAVDCNGEVEILSRIQRNLAQEPLAGFIAEGTVPAGALVAPIDAALRQAIFSGMPVVKVARGNADGISAPDPGGLFVGGSNLTATKARILLMASMMKLGSLPPARDPNDPTPEEIAGVKAKVAEYQAIFDTH